jgi:hypothetical protein
MTELLAIQCPFCGGHTRPRPLAQSGATVGLYLAHLLESHWETLVALRATVSDREGHDAWTRL